MRGRGAADPAGIGEDGRMPSLSRAEAVARPPASASSGYRWTWTSPGRVRTSAPGPECASPPCPARRLSSSRARRGCSRSASTTARLDPAGLTEDRLPLAGLAAENELVSRPRWRTRTRARACTGSSTRPTARSTSTRSRSSTTRQRIFACFDQPDLKAPVTLSVTAPGRLEGAGNGAGTPRSRRAGGSSRRPSRWRPTSSR